MADMDIDGLDLSTPPRDGWPSSLLPTPPDLPEYAGFGERFIAFIIDALIMAAIFIVLYLPFALLMGDNGSGGKVDVDFFFLNVSLRTGSRAETVIVMSLGILVFFAYPIILLQWNQRTLGMRLFALRLVGEKGDDARFWAVAARVLAAIISALVIYIGYLWALFDKDNRTWHDIIARTCVIKDVRKKERAPE